MKSASLVILLGLLTAGCADTTEPPPTTAQTDPGDPWETTNRDIFAMNENFDHHVLAPLAQFYVDTIPDAARTGLHNALTNFNSPVVFGNDVLQGEAKLAGQTLGRFTLNSTIGLGGLIDVATPVGIPYHTADFGQTLGVWGVGDTPYMVLPLIGPTNPRDTAGQIVDIVMDPLNYIGIHDYTLWSVGEESLVILDTRARNIDMLNALEESSVDQYASVRSLYRQYRAGLVRHGKTDVKNLPDM